MRAACADYGQCPCEGPYTHAARQRRRIRCWRWCSGSRASGRRTSDACRAFGSVSVRSEISVFGRRLQGVEKSTTGNLHKQDMLQGQMAAVPVGTGDHRCWSPKARWWRTRSPSPGCRWTPQESRYWRSLTTVGRQARRAPCRQSILRDQGIRGPMRMVRHDGEPSIRGAQSSGRGGTENGEQIEAN
jgi:hypothetical protein